MKLSCAALGEQTDEVILPGFGHFSLSPSTKIQAIESSFSKTLFSVCENTY